QLPTTIRVLVIVAAVVYLVGVQLPTARINIPRSPDGPHATVGRRQVVNHIQTVGGLGRRPSYTLGRCRQSDHTMLSRVEVR
ncbi:MAG TPA: hypothetical protein VES20_22640, partial [Bryobacteraceae bacterium]|nr:hypothetical protein [Bryobacteraceae bacterium]